MLPSSTRARPGDGHGLLGRPSLAVVLLLGAYALVALLGDTRAGMGSDAGGKLATARVMAEAGTISPDVGYWAEALDPEGRFHPLVNTERVGDHWVQATSLPYSEATAPLWSLGGPAGVVALSMAGGLAAACAARRLARRLGGHETLAFWLVGLGSPLAVYATDAWEHAPAVGLALWGLTLALEADSPVAAAVVGALLGSAVLLRAEVAAYVLAFAVASLLVPAVRRRWTSRPSLLAAGAVTAGGLLVANALFERSLLDAGVRDARAGAGAGDAGSELGRRATDAVVTGGGLFADDTAVGLLIAGLLAAGLVVVALRLVGIGGISERLLQVSTGLVVALYAMRLFDGWAFVPGALATAPVMVLAIAAVRTDEVRVLLGTALGALPLVWAAQWKGNHVAQWGGRYLLMTTVLLIVVATVVLAGPVGKRAPARLLVGLTALMALVGAGWHVQRTEVVGGAGSELASLPDDTVVVATHLHLGRELGSWYDDHRWLSTEGDLIPDALRVAEQAAPPVIALIEQVGPGAEPPTVPELDGYDLAETRSIPYLGSNLEVLILVRH